MVCFIHLSPTPPNRGKLCVTLLLSNTEKSISYCTGRPAANFIRELNESIFSMCSMTQCRKGKQEQPWRYVGSFSNARKGTGWCSGTDVLVSAGQWCCLIAPCDSILQGIILLLKSFTSLGILNKNFHRKKIQGWKMKFGNDKVKAFLRSSPWLHDHYVCWTGSKAELDTPSELWWSLVWFTTKVGWYALYETCGCTANNEHKNKNWTAASFAKHVHLVHWARLGSCREKKKKASDRISYIYIHCMQIHQYRMLYKAGICPGLQTDIRIKDILENIAFLATCVGSKEL